MGKRSHQYGPNDKPRKSEGDPEKWTGGNRRALKDTPGPVGERLRAEADEKLKKERERLRATEKVRNAIAHMRKVAGDRPLVACERLIAEHAQEEMLIRFEQSPETIPIATLNKIKDSAIGSVARSERWDKGDNTSPGKALEALTARMAQLGRSKLKIEAWIEPESEIIDVTPQKPALPNEVGTTLDAEFQQE